MTQPGGPPTALEERGAELGIRFSRGRTWTSNSRRALEAAEWAASQDTRDVFHKALFEAYFTRLEDINDLEVLARVAEESGMDAQALREALAEGAYTKMIDDGIAMAYRVGITAVPTFVIDQRYAVVGAQDQLVFRDLLRRLGKVPLTGGA
jgi:predicted DsbA family dithiol-disulfide isomerase